MIKELVIKKKGPGKPGDEAETVVSSAIGGDQG